jgi:hypothetical protein
MEAEEPGSPSTGKGDALVQAIWGEIGKSVGSKVFFKQTMLTPFFMPDKIAEHFHPS